MKKQVLFSLKNESIKIKCRLLQFLFGTLKVNRSVFLAQSVLDEQ